jgi:hypothetical protein
MFNYARAAEHHAGEPKVSARMMFALLNQSEQFVGPLKQSQRRLTRQGIGNRGVTGQELSSAMLADQRPSEILHAHVKTAPAGGTFLGEIGYFRHGGNSVYRWFKIPEPWPIVCNDPT